MAYEEVGKSRFQQNKTYRVRAAALKHTKWNPEDRINSDTCAFKSLAKSLVKDGQQAPVIITKDGYIIDGNRRTAACALLGMKVWCVVSGSDPEMAYRVLNTANTQRAIRGNAVLNVYLLNPEAINPRTRRRLDQIMQFLGLDSFRRFYMNGGNLATWEQAKTLISYLQWGNLRTVAQWMAKHRQSLKSRIAISTGMDKEEIKHQILADEPLSLAF